VGASPTRQTLQPEAGVSHAFETFTNDFKTWVIFFGPKGGYEGGDRVGTG
jgi:hypothetical protein